MDTKTHWEKVYTTKAPDAVSWYRTHLEISLSLIERAAAARSASIIDVNGGESTLVDDLLLRGYKNITVLDISQAAIDLTNLAGRQQVEEAIRNVPSPQARRRSRFSVAEVLFFPNWNAARNHADPLAPYLVRMRTANPQTDNPNCCSDGK